MILNFKKICSWWKLEKTLVFCLLRTATEYTPLLYLNDWKECVDDLGLRVLDLLVPRPLLQLGYVVPRQGDIPLESRLVVVVV